MTETRTTADGRIIETRRSGSTWLVLLLLIVLGVVAAFAFGLIDVDQTQKAVAPTVNVEGGQAPTFDVNTADIDVGTKTETVEVPTVEVTPADKK